MIRSLAFIAFVCLAATAGAARADPDDADRLEIVHIRLAVKPADLSTPEGLRTLYSRIQIAADRACTDAADTGRPVPSRDQACYAQAVSSTVRDLNIPELSRLDDRGHTYETLALADDRRPGQ